MISASELFGIGTYLSSVNKPGDGMTGSSGVCFGCAGFSTAIYEILQDIQTAFRAWWVLSASRKWAPDRSGFVA